MGTSETNVVVGHSKKLYAAGEYKANRDSFKVHVPVTQGHEATITLPPSVSNVKQINLVDVEIPVTRYNVNRTNNRVYFNEYAAVTEVKGQTGTETSGVFPNAQINFDMTVARFFAEITPGTYTSTQYASAVAVAMNHAWTKIDGSAGSAAAPQNTYLAHFDAITGKMLVSAGTFTGTPGSSFTQTAFQPTAFAIRPHRVSTLAAPQCVAVIHNPLNQTWNFGGTLGGYAVPADPTETSDPIDTAGLIVFRMDSRDHAYIPGDPVTVIGGASRSPLDPSNTLYTQDGSGRSTPGRVTLVHNENVFVMPLVARANANLSTGVWTDDADDETTRAYQAHKIVGSEPSQYPRIANMGIQAGAIQGVFRSVSFFGETTATAAAAQHTFTVYSNVAPSLTDFFQTGFRGDIPCVCTSTKVVPMQHHLIGAGASLDFDGSTKVAVSSAEDTEDRVPVLTMASSALAQQTHVFETAAAAGVHGTSSVRTSLKLDLTRGFRCVFIELDCLGPIGPVGRIYVSPSERVFFGRVQLDADLEGIEMNHDTALGIHTFETSVALKEIRVRLFTENGEPLELEGVSGSLMLELIDNFY